MGSVYKSSDWATCVHAMHMRAYAMHTLVRMRTPMRTPESPSPWLYGAVYVACWLWAQWGPGASAATRQGATVRPGHWQTPAIMIGPTTGMHLAWGDGT